MRKLAPVVAALVVVLASALCSSAVAAEKENLPVTVVFKDKREVGLKSLEVGISKKGLFGDSFETLKKLPVKIGKLRLDVPIDKLVKIEILSADKQGKKVEVTLTPLKGKPLTGMLDSEEKIVWKGKHPFADSDATFDVADIKEILLRPKTK